MSERACGLGGPGGRGQEEGGYRLIYVLKVDTSYSTTTIARLLFLLERPGRKSPCEHATQTAFKTAQ